MSIKSKSPSIRDTAFNCPHCNALTSQHWFNTWAQYIRKDKDSKGTPFLMDAEFIEKVRNNNAIDRTVINVWEKQYEKLSEGYPFLKQHESSEYLRMELQNVFLSECYNCHKISIWLRDKLVYPSYNLEIEPNDDLPMDIQNDFNEAREIIQRSPRGAAALARLCIQKICIVLGENGDNLNNAIAGLVQKGLNPNVQKSLDIVRVIGNESVHPGKIDMKDDLNTAFTILELVNLISEQMISIPKKLNVLYDELPEEKRNAIEKRDKK